MIVVIADDLTGAAEIAGICWRYGLRTRLSLGAVEEAACDALVVATETRQLPVASAVAETRRIAASLPPTSSLFKKTDSALRGHVMEELTALLDTTRFTRALYMPANPSKGRILRGGIYLVGGQPLSDTPFADDPEYPAWTSSITERFPQLSRWSSPLRPGLFYADAVVTDDLRCRLKEADADTLPAGGADLFEVWLEYLGFTASATTILTFPTLRNAVLVCGSTQSKGLPGMESCEMPPEVYMGKTPVDEWTSVALNVWTHSHRVMLSIPGTSRKDAVGATYLREATAEVVNRLLSTGDVDELLIEGGATAYAVLSRMGCRSLLLEGELSPGVVSCRHGDLRIIMKPGSYEWPF